MIKEDFKYILLNQENKVIGELQKVEGASISYTSLSRLKMSARIDLVLGGDETINVNHKIQIRHVLEGVERILGTFVVSTPGEERNGLYKNVSLSCYSVLWYLEADKLTSRYYVPRGTNVINEIKRKMAERFPNLTLTIEESTKTTTTDREFEIGTPYLDVFNDLLQVINFTSLYPLKDGGLSAREYVQPTDRTIDKTYSEKDTNSQLDVISSVELDYFNVPNIFVRYVNTPDTLDMIAKYENTNINSPTSTYNRPPNVSAEEVQDAADIQTLMNIAKRDCAAATNAYSKIEFRTSINAEHNYMNCIQIVLNGIDDKYIETSWDIDCKIGGWMTHKARKAVEI